jgi:hypothetical protein
VNVPEFAMTALVVSTGTIAGVQLLAVFQLPLEAAAQEVCARLAGQKPKMTAPKHATIRPVVVIN